MMRTFTVCERSNIAILKQSMKERNKVREIEIDVARGRGRELLSRLG
jgi:hypothetical protein